MSRRKEIRFPEPVEPPVLAKRLADGNPLRVRIVEALVGHPHRYSELRPLLGGKGDENLNRALRGLLQDGIVDRSSDIGHSPPVDHYELSELGVRVFCALIQRRSLEQLLERLTTELRPADA